MQLHQDAQHILSKRFKIKNLLGKGSFGNVYECQEKKDNQPYAIKIISKLNVKRSKIQCLREEATLLLSLDHPNIVKVFEFFQDQRVMFIKMQFVKNGTLGQLMRQRESNKSPFSDQQSSQIMNGIFKAVNYIHSLSILHRDIKPQNILVPDKNQLDKLKIADFGLGAKLQFRSPTATSKCGTYLFMAPEIMWNYTYTKAVDIWSCSIIMYLLKKGCHPFYQTKMTNQDFKEKIKSVVFPPLEDQNPENSDIIKIKLKDDPSQALNKKKKFLAQDLMSRISKLSPNQRYTAQDAIKHPWITRNFEDEIPLSLHDSFQGFQISHQISLMMKMLIVLKNMHFKKQQRQKTKKNQIFQKYSRHCEQVNRKDRSVSPLKIRRLSNLNSTRQISQLCQLSQLSMSPKKLKLKQKRFTEMNDHDNPTIIKLNKIFNNLFDKKQKKEPISYAQQFMNNLNQNQGVQKCYEFKQIPDISKYRENIQKQIQNAVKERHKRKKQRILPRRKKNQYGQAIGVSCETAKISKILKKQNHQANQKNEQKNGLNNSMRTSSIHDALTTKIRVRRRVSNNSAISAIQSTLTSTISAIQNAKNTSNANKYFT